MSECPMRSQVRLGACIQALQCPRQRGDNVLRSRADDKAQGVNPGLAGHKQVWAADDDSAETIVCPKRQGLSGTTCGREWSFRKTPIEARIDYTPRGFRPAEEISAVLLHATSRYRGAVPHLLQWLRGKARISVLFSLEAACKWRGVDQGDAHLLSCPTLTLRQCRLPCH
jgi:hypothetical protein